MIYVCATLASALCAYLSKKNYYISANYHFRKISFVPKIFIFISMMILAGISAVRYQCGTDFSSYWLMYDQQGSASKERGFAVLISMLHKISQNPQVLFVATSFVICACYFYMIYKESTSPALSVFLFVTMLDYFGSMNGIRQYIAIAIIILALPDIKSRNWKRALVLLLLALWFHQSVLIIVLLYILFAIDIRPIQAFSLVVGMFFFGYILWEPISRFAIKYTRYGKYFYSTSKYFISNTCWEYILIYLTLFVLSCFIYKKFNENKDVKLLYTSTLIALIVSVTSTFMPTTITRMTWYFNPVIILYLPNALNLLKNKKTRFIIKICIVAAFSIYCIIYTVHGRHDVLPYKTYWDVFGNWI